MEEYRCSYCKNLLLKWEGNDLTVEVRCNNCKCFNILKFKRVFEEDLTKPE